ncbi:MAG: hypothetical protein WDO15_00395 [Bacteroidota bacterium]
MGRVLLIAFLFACAATYGQSRTQVVFDNDDLSDLHARMEFNLGALLTDFNTAFVAKKAPGFDDGVVLTDDAKKRILQLWSSGAFRCPEVNLKGNILKLASGGYQFRNIPLSIDNHPTGEEAEVNMDLEGRIEDVYFGIDQQKYIQLLGKSNTLVDLKRRAMIVDFLENFRTAYNRKDLDLLQKTFSDNALIIVGRVLEPKPDQPEMMMSLGKKRVEMIQYNKQQYLEQLKKCFTRNSFIDVKFDQVEITRHPAFENIYGVNVKQSWRSATYGDVGYLFLMIDFTNEKEPLIHVRSWQPEKETAKEEVIELGDFDIIK